MSKLNWLDKFAQEQSKKMKKTASFNKQAEQIIVDQDDVPGAVDGQELSYNNQLYKVVNANFQDEMGPGVILERIAGFECGEILPEEMSMEMGTGTVPCTDGTKVTVAPERAVQPNQGNSDLHIEVRDTVEVDKFNQEAVETESQIAQENAIDRTVPEGKYNRIEKRIQDKLTFDSVEDTLETTEEDVETLEEDTSESTEEGCEDFTDVDEDGICDTCGLPEEECEEDKKIISNRILSKLFK